MESSRRGFLGGVGALVAAATYTRDVPAAVAARVTNDEDDASSATIRRTGRSR